MDIAGADGVKLCLGKRQQAAIFNLHRVDAAKGVVGQVNFSDNRQIVSGGGAAVDRNGIIIISNLVKQIAIQRDVQGAGAGVVDDERIDFVVFRVEAAYRYIIGAVNRQRGGCRVIIVDRNVVILNH